MNYCVCSYGGCASKVLVNFLIKYGSVYHIHSRKPPVNLTKPQKEYFTSTRVVDYSLDQYKIIYIARSPVEAFLSRFGYSTFKAIQSPHMGILNTVCPDAVKQLDESHVINYLSHGVDLAGYESFYNNYVTKDINANYPIYIINYHKMWTHTEKIVTSLGLDVSAVKQFPEKIECKTSAFRVDGEENGGVHGFITKDTLDNLKQLYKSLEKKVKHLPSISIR